MITISKGDRVAGLPDLIVSSPSGEYADVDLILCARKDAPNFDAAMYQAQFIRYGEVVYQHETPEALGAVLVAIDPESTHDAAQLWREEEKRRIAREGGTLVPEDQTPAPDAVEPQTTIPEEEEDDVKFFKEKEEEAATTTPDEAVPDREIPVIDIEEPPLGEVGGAASSTEPIADPSVPVIQIDEPVVTPPVEDVPALDMSSTTPQ
ncbi:MAG TPA: hypothetical protein PK109_02090 [Candidatus Paceibacterota bacterium]|nr:hypothetical protein [Candidatus Paceibacterota bacterium]